MNEIISDIESNVMSKLGIYKIANATEKMIETLVNLEIDSFRELGLPPPSEEERLFLIRSIQHKLAVKIDYGACVKVEHVPWFGAAMRDNDRKYWKRYEKYQYSKFNRDIVYKLDRTSDEIMDLLGNPKDSAFQRKGLIIGDVQSGKTGTYTAIMNKAADAGYKVIILLTGVIEKLRRQTQSRIDSDFVGVDSSLFRKNNGKAPNLGVGNIDKDISVYVMTSTESDFKSNITNSLSSISDPVLFVVKKNKPVLTRLETWLASRNKNASGEITYPMLLIDDEADNASVNTRSPDQDPTAINACIKKILKLFTKSNYVGVTATPYANIFIDPDTDDDMLGDDLFPKDFIYALEPPSNYIGARNIFGDDGEEDYMLHFIDDSEGFLPLNHKSDYRMSGLPGSLKEALASFFIINAIRDLNGEGNTHRSMLVNISRFIAVHKIIYEHVSKCVDNWKSEIRNYSQMGDVAQQYETFAYFKDVFDKYFAKDDVTKFDWVIVRKTLQRACSDICVRVVNGGNASNMLDYEDHKADGLRIIAIGGVSLSRGLTLEGLCVSYFYRNSKMYDTLMQMGRWFGYRDSYKHLCQIWMGQSMFEWYRYISEATDDLRNQVKRMQNDKRTPDDFGLAVRSDMASLLITARNKMRTAQDFTRTITFSGKVVETPYLHLDTNILASNIDIISNWVKDLRSNNYHFITKVQGLAKPEVPIIRNLPLTFIKDLLSKFVVHSANINFNPSDLNQIISDGNPIFDKWDVAIATTTSDTSRSTDFLGEKIIPTERTFLVIKDRRAIQISTRRRLGSIDFAKSGLLESEVKKIVENWKKISSKVTPEHEFFSSGAKRNPLLIIYPISLNPQEGDEIATKVKKELPNILVGLAIGIPKIDGHPDVAFKYKINKRKSEEIMESDGSDDAEECDETTELGYEA